MKFINILWWKQLDESHYGCWLFTRFKINDVQHWRAFLSIKNVGEQCFEYSRPTVICPKDSTVMTFTNNNLHNSISTHFGNSQNMLTIIKLKRKKKIVFENVLKLDVSNSWSCLPSCCNRSFCCFIKTVFGNWGEQLYSLVGLSFIMHQTCPLSHNSGLQAGQFTTQTLILRGALLK